MKNAFFVIGTSLIISALSIFVISDIADAQTANANLTPAERAALEAQLTQVLAQEAQAQQQLTAAQSQSASLSSQIAVLDAKIKAANLDIQAKNLLIQTLGSDIVVQQGHIDDLEAQIAAGKQTLADILRKTNEIDQTSLPELMLSETSVSGFFKDIDTFQSVQQGLANTFDLLQTDEASTTVEKDALTTQQNSAEDARYAIQQEQASVKTDEAQQKQLLAISKGNEQSYSSLVSEEQAQAAKIRAALFNLAGGSNPIPFGTALQYAQTASQATGVDPAFLLAILTQESNLGGNVGRCYLTDPNTGAGVFVSDGSAVTNVMSPVRDVPPFLTLTKALGVNPYQTIVSCQLGGSGWGGAMGPAQFIASTWVLLSDRVAAALSIPAPANPWDPKQAIMAEALYMEDLGAGAGGYTAERNAACRYYSGRGCGIVPGATAYGNSVMAIVNNTIQPEINQLQAL